MQICTVSRDFSILSRCVADFSVITTCLGLGMLKLR